jgi:hypothetical protein
MGVELQGLRDDQLVDAAHHRDDRFGAYCDSPECSVWTADADGPHSRPKVLVQYDTEGSSVVWAHDRAQKHDESIHGGKGSLRLVKYPKGLPQPNQKPIDRVMLTPQIVFRGYALPIRG